MQILCMKTHTETQASDTAKVGERLRRLREARGESMSVAREIRERFGVKLDPSYLSRMERGRAEIPLRTLFALARYYGVAPADLVHLEEFQQGGAVEELFSRPDLKTELEELYASLGRDQLLQLLWWYFRILKSTMEGSEEQERRTALKGPVSAQQGAVLNKLRVHNL